ncbi:MAG: hypothetical protein EP310_06650, partial [Bacteroidetes bacterium]
MKFLTVTIKLLTVTTLLICFLNSCNNQQTKNHFYYPADFDPVYSTWFIWTNEFYEIIPKLASIISRNDKITLFFHESEADTIQINNLLEKYNGNTKNINLIKLNTKLASKWIRDFGPVYMINAAGDIKLIDFGHFGKRIGFTKEIGAKMNLPVIQSLVNSSG